MTTLEAQAKQKLYLKQIYIENKFFKLSIEAEDKVKLDKQKALAKAERQVKQRLINQEKKIKNKQRAKEGKPLLKVRKPKPINLKTGADKYFSRCVRSIGARQGSDGIRYNRDIITGEVLPIKNLTCGHYVTRNVFVLRFDLRNCAPQAHGTNSAEQLDISRKGLFRQKLIERDGLDSVLEVDKKFNSRRRNDNEHVSMQEEHDKRKEEYQKVKHMRE